MGKKHVISVIGTGALGKLYGGALFLAGHEVHCLVRSEYETIKQQGFYELKLNESGKTYKIDNPNIQCDPTQLPPSDFVIVSVKTTENKNLASLLAPTLKKDTVIIVIQNGIGNEEYISKLFPHHTILSTISYAAVTNREKALAEVFTVSSLWMALFNTTDTQLFKTIENLFLSKLKPEFIIYQNYKQMRWKKVIWNLPFGAASILFNKSTDILASEKPYYPIIKSIMEEIQTIAKAEGAIITDEEIKQIIQDSCEMKNYYPSTYWDYTKGRLIEKEYIMDNVLEIAKKHNIKAPVLEKIIHDLDLKLKKKSNSRLLTNRLFGLSLGIASLVVGVMSISSLSWIFIGVGASLLLGTAISFLYTKNVLNMKKSLFLHKDKDKHNLDSENYVKLTDLNKPSATTRASILSRTVLTSCTKSSSLNASTGSSGHKLKK